MADSAGFEWFSPVSGVPMVSIAEYGLTFNRAAVTKLGAPSRVMIGFDRKRRLLGIRPVDDSGEGVEQAFPFASRIRDGYVRIASKDLVRYISTNCPELDFSRTLKFAGVWGDSGMMVVDLRRPVGGGKNGEA